MLDLQMAFINLISSPVCFTVSFTVRYPFQSRGRKPILGYQVAACLVLFSLAVASLSAYTVLCVEVPDQKSPNLLGEIIKKDVVEFLEDAQSQGLVDGYSDIITDEIKKGNPELGALLDFVKGAYGIINTAGAIDFPVSRGNGNVQGNVDEDSNGAFPSTNGNDALENVVEGLNAAVDLYSGIVGAAGYLSNTTGDNGTSNYSSNGITVFTNALASAENLVRNPGETLASATGNVSGNLDFLVGEALNMLRNPGTVASAVENLLKYPAATVANVTDNLLRNTAETVYSEAAGSLESNDESIIGATINNLRYPGTVATAAENLQRYPAVSVASVAENLLRDPVGSVAVAAGNLVRDPVGSVAAAAGNVIRNSESLVKAAVNSPSNSELPNAAGTVITDAGNVLVQPGRIVVDMLNQVMDPQGSLATAAADMLANPEALAVTVGAAGKLITDTAKVVDSVAQVATAFSTVSPSTNSSRNELSEIIEVSKLSTVSESTEKVINPGSYLGISWPPETTTWRRPLRNGEYVELEKVRLKSKSMFDKGWFLKFRTPAVGFKFGMDGTGMLYFNREVRPIARIHCPAYNFPEDLPEETYPILVTLNNPSGLLYASNGERFQKIEYLTNSMASYSQPAGEGQAIALKKVVGITNIHVDIHVSFSVCWIFLVDISGNLPWLYDMNYGEGVAPNGVYAKLNVISHGRVIYGSQRMYCHLTEVNMIFNYKLKAFRRKVSLNLKLKEYEDVLVEYYLDYIFVTFPGTVEDRIDMFKRYMTFDKLWKQTVDDRKKTKLLEAIRALKKDDVLDRLEKQLHDEYYRTLQLENEEMIFHVSLYTQNNSPIVDENGDLVVFTKRVLVPSLLSLKQSVEKEFIEFLRMITKIDKMNVVDGIAGHPNYIFSDRNSFEGDSNDNSENMSLGGDRNDNSENMTLGGGSNDNSENMTLGGGSNDNSENMTLGGGSDDNGNGVNMLVGGHEVEDRNNGNRWNILSPMKISRPMYNHLENPIKELGRTKVHFLSCGSRDFGNFVPRNEEDFRERVNRAYDTLLKNYGGNLEEFDWRVPGFKKEKENLKIRWSDLLTLTGVDVDSLSEDVSKVFKVADKRLQMPKFKLHVELDPETSEYEVLLVSPESLQRLNSEVIFLMGHQQSEMEKLLKAQANRVALEENASPIDAEVSQPPFSLYVELVVRDREGSVVYGPTLMHCPYISIPKLPTEMGPLVFEATLRSTEHGEITDDFSRVIKVKHFSFKDSDVFSSVLPNATECGNVMFGARLLDVDYEDFVDNNALQGYVRSVFAETLGREYDDVKICEVKEGSTLIGFSTPDVKKDKENWDTAVLIGSYPVHNVFQLDDKFPTVFKNSGLEEACLSEDSTCLEQFSLTSTSAFPTPSPVWKLIDLSTKRTENNEDATFPWWAWLLIAMGILLVAIVVVVVIVLMYRRRRKGFDNLEKCTTNFYVSEAEVLPKVG